MSETPLTPEQQAELAEGIQRLQDDTPHIMTVLKLWTIMLHQLDDDEKMRLAPAVARKVTLSWTNLTIQEVPEYFDNYHKFLREAQAVLAGVLELDPEALEQTEGDGDVNDFAYLNVMLAWNELTILWELDWEATDASAHIELAALADAAAYLLGSQGFMGYLEGINFRYTNDEDELFKSVLTDWKAGL